MIINRKVYNLQMLIRQIKRLICGNILIPSDFLAIYLDLLYRPKVIYIAGSRRFTYANVNYLIRIYPYKFRSIQ